MFEYINKVKFFSKYAKKVTSYRKKVSGKNTNGNQITFTDQDKEQMITGVNKMAQDLIKYIKNL